MTIKELVYSLTKLVPNPFFLRLANTGFNPSAATVAPPKIRFLTNTLPLFTSLLSPPLLLFSYSAAAATCATISSAFEGSE